MQPWPSVLSLSCPLSSSTLSSFTPSQSVIHFIQVLQVIRFESLKSFLEAVGRCLSRSFKAYSRSVWGCGWRLGVAGYQPAFVAENSTAIVRCSSFPFRHARSHDTHRLPHWRWRRPGRQLAVQYAASRHAQEPGTQRCIQILQRSRTA